MPGAGGSADQGSDCGPGPLTRVVIMATPARLPTVGVILAGGVGTRLGQQMPKQLLKIAGKPIIEHTIGVLNAAPELDELIVLMAPGYVRHVEDIVAAGRYSKVTAVLSGGQTRSETTQIALNAIRHEEANIVLHDAVRPLLSHRIIRECVNALRDYGAVDVAIPSADTIIQTAGRHITHIPDRSRLRRGQTPQCFRLSIIRSAYELARQDAGFVATDDCSVVLRYLPEVPIYVIEGSPHNIKITDPLDLFIADRLFQLRSSPLRSTASPEVYAEELRGRVAVVFGGSYGIGLEIVDLLRKFGTQVYSYSRSATATHVENPEDVRAGLQSAYGEAGRIDFVINAAGRLHTEALVEMDVSVMEQMVATNYLAPMYIARESFQYLRETKGQLLLFTSSSHTRGRAQYSVYSSSKAAVVNLMHGLADEWSDAGVGVNCLNPERTATPMRLQAFGVEPAETLLTPQMVATAALDVLLAGATGHTVDVTLSGILDADNDARTPDLA